MPRVSTYLNFSRSTEKAFVFYQSVFGREFAGPIHRLAQFLRRQDSPLAESDKNLVMHIELPILGGHVLMGTDAPESMGFSLTQGNNVYINIEPDTRAETDKLFNALSVNGKAEMPCGHVLGRLLGSLTDQFGIRWMFNCASKT